ncbi:MAG: hypothetical protein Q8R06_14490 [Polaromonas sp.]|uniref:hypothetical protein n=1 Tax=Polaromonas sp. TaxID=1869339 RepID=UPI002736D891|nr:hypothetical protein [Polaromonas sp.]MDP3798330.1 hypothetical protein [Polaromonas sp.]
MVSIPAMMILALPNDLNPSIGRRCPDGRIEEDQAGGGDRELEPMLTRLKLMAIRGYTKPAARS